MVKIKLQITPTNSRHQGTYRASIAQSFRSRKPPLPRPNSGNRTLLATLPSLSYRYRASMTKAMSTRCRRNVFRMTCKRTSGRHRVSFRPCRRQTCSKGTVGHACTSLTKWPSRTWLYPAASSQSRH